MRVPSLRVGAAEIGDGAQRACADGIVAVSKVWHAAFAPHFMHRWSLRCFAAALCAQVNDASDSRILVRVESTRRRNKKLELS